MSLANKRAAVSFAEFTADPYGKFPLSFCFPVPDRQHQSPRRAEAAESSPGSFSIEALSHNGDMCAREHARGSRGGGN
jgi:hypothetical protein